MPTFRLVTASAKYGSRKIKSKRRNGGTQALREEAAKSGAGGADSMFTATSLSRLNWRPRPKTLRPFSESQNLWTAGIRLRASCAGRGEFLRIGQVLARRG